MKSRKAQNEVKKDKRDEFFFRAAKQEELGNLQAAFRLYLAGAKIGDKSCQLNLGHCYDAGSGVRKNRSAAFYWYRRLYRRGDACAANNIGTIWRDEGQPKRALSWFKKSVRLGDDEAHLEIAKHHLQNEHDPAKAMPHLQKVCRSNCVTEASQETAAKLLKQAKRELAKLRS
jgi:TPR repeat protein